MRVFVTGATGFIGSAIVKDLLTAGHQVLGLARSDAGAEKVAATGAEVHRGSLEDVESLKRGASATDGVIHTAYIHDFSRIAISGEVDLVVVNAIGDALAGTNKPFVVTSALGALAGNKVAVETDAADPKSPGAHRLASERAALALKDKGVRASVVRLPPSVHGDGDYGFMPAYIAAAREKSTAVYVGEGATRWAAVHRFDAAVLYRLALEKGAAGAVFHGVADEGIPTRELAEIVGRKLGVSVASKTSEEAAAYLTWLTKFFAMDMQASSARTREALGWKPAQPGLVADLEHGTYFK